MTRPDGPDAGTASYDAAPTPRKPPEPGGPFFPESHLTSSSNDSVAANGNEAPGSAAEYRYPRPSPQGIPPDVNPFRVSPQTQPGTFQQIVPSERWMTNMRIVFNSPAPGSTSMTVPVMVDQARLKSCVWQPLVVLCRYPTNNVAPPGSIEPSPVVDILVELDKEKLFILEKIEMVTNDPGAGAAMIIGRDDLAQIEAHLGHPLCLRRNDNSGSSATRDVLATSYGTCNDNHVGFDMAFPNQGTLSAVSDEWS
ncbi:hypothetical protein BR93DRAFT_204776 [Coniochaeta sp. PMI_546]|nr:hypothetical protein BR93DRAFT_204776 [Coniochaeta sp. PMI_546]